MFEFVRTHSRWLQMILLLLILPSFVALGVQGYSSFMDGGANRVATVDGHGLTQLEWDAAMRDQAERIRRQNPKVDPKLLDSPEARKQALQQMLNQRVLLATAANQHLEIAPEREQSLVLRDENLAPVRGADGRLSANALMQRGIEPNGFIRDLRQGHVLRQVLAPIESGQGSPALATKLAYDALLQRREVSFKRVDPNAFKAQVQISDADLQAHYQKPETQKRWLAPEHAQIEYLVLEPDALKAAIKVDEAELRDYYKNNAARFGTPEERRARHILIKLDAGAKPADEKAARDKAEALLAQLKKDPKQFAELARKHSQDEVSAANGGDLDFFARDAMVKPFSDAAYALKVGEISGIVRSEYGLHLIELTGVRGGDMRAFEQVRGEIEEQRRVELAKQKYQELSESFSNMVYEQGDALKPVAEKFGLKLQTAEVQRQPQPGQAGPLASAKLLEILFSADSLRAKHNTEAVEAAPMQLVSARVIKHVPAAAPPLDEVKEALRMQMLQERAAELAKKDGETQLAALQKDPASGAWDAPKWVSRAAPGGLPRPALEAALRAGAAKLPAVVGVDLGNAGYLLMRVSQVSEPADDVLKPEQAREEYARAWANAEGQAYLEALKAATKAKILVKLPTEAAK